jgi:hypothetical protein
MISMKRRSTDMERPLTRDARATTVGAAMPSRSPRWPIPVSGALLALLTLGAAPFDPAREGLPPPARRSPAPPGRVLFQDDFSHDSLAGWSPDREHVWSVRGGMLRGDLPDRRQEHSVIYAGAASWTDVAVDFDVCGMRGVDKGVVVRADDPSHAVGVDLRGPGYQDVVMRARQWPLGRAQILNANGMWHHLRIEARGQRFRVWVNGVLSIDRSDAHHARSSGRIGLAAYTGGVGECTVYFDNVVVTEVR